MNNLFSHIEYLLLSHDCVIVPGLGAFLAVMRPAAIDYDRGLITPPSRSVIFNQAISSDDGLLANSYSRKHRLTFEEARQVVLRDVSMLNVALETEKEIAVGKLGVLKCGEEGNLVFVPRLNLNDANSILGFGSLNISKPEVTAEVNAPEAVAESTDTSRKSYYQFRIKKTFSRIAAAVMVLAVIIVAAIFKPIPTDNREQRASVVPVEAIIPEKAKEVAKNIVRPNSVDTSNVTEDDKSNAKEESELPSHYLIVATFSSSREAMKYVAYNSSADSPMQIVGSLKVTRVAIASSNNKEDLRRRLNSKEIRSKYPSAWIWSRK